MYLLHIVAEMIKGDSTYKVPSMGPHTQCLLNKC